MPEASPISLYFDLPEGKHADLEVLARATVEWVAAIRDIASVMAPGIEFEIEFVESEDGSVWLSNLLKAVREGDRKALTAITSATVLFFALGPALHLQEDFGDAFWSKLGHEHKEDISDESKAEIIAGVKKAIEVTPIVQRRRNIILQAEKDQDICGVGVDLKPSKSGPTARIPRELFPVYGAADPGSKEVAPKDTEHRSAVRVKIIRANLEEGETRPRWRFSEGDNKWSADLEDDEFVEALQAKTTGLPLAYGQTMVIDVAVDLKFVDGAWSVVNRRITRVREPSVERRQSSLELGGQ